MPLPSRTATLGTLLALTFGLALRLWFTGHTSGTPNDTLVYGAIARNWMQHGVYGFAADAGMVQPTLIRLPGYPLFLVLCFRLFGVGNYHAVALVQIAIDLLICLLLAGMAGRVFGTKARVGTLWLAALCPFTAGYTALLLTETLTLACTALAFHALQQWRSDRDGRWLTLLILALSYSILLRPEQGLLAAAILPAMLWIAWRRERSVRAAAPVMVAALCILLPLLPWAIRNERTFHVFQSLAPRYANDPGEAVNFGFQRWYCTWAIDFASTEDVYWNYDGAQIALDDLPSRAFDTQAQRAVTAALLADYNPTANATPALDARWEGLAEERIAAHPLRYYILLPGARLLNMLLRPRTENLSTHLNWWSYREHPRETVFATTYAALNLVYLALATWGAVLWRRSGRELPLLWAMLAFVALRCALLLTLDNSEPRYTLEFFPIVFLLAGLPLSRRVSGSSRPSSYPS